MMNMFNMAQQQQEAQEEVTEDIRTNRRTILEQLEKGLLDNREVTIEIEEPKKTMPAMNNGLEQMGIDLNETLGALSPKKNRTYCNGERSTRIISERRISKIVNDADIHSEAIRLAESSGIILSMRLIKSPLKVNKIRAKSLVKEYKEIFCRLLKAPKLTRSMVLYKRITFYLSLQVLSTCQNQVT